MAAASTDIHRGNGARLGVAWTYRHGDVKRGRLRPDQVDPATSFEGTPLVVDGRLAFATPFNRVMALDRRPVASSGPTTRRSTNGAFYARPELHCPEGFVFLGAGGV